MKKLLLLLLFIPLVSCKNVEVRKTYYESGELASTGKNLNENAPKETKYIS